MVSQADSSKYWEMNEYLSFWNYSQKLKRKEHFWAHSMKPSLWHQNQTKIPQKRKLQANMTDESLFFTRFYFLQGCACDSKYQCHLPHLHMYKLYSSLKAKINDIFSMKSPPVFLVWSTLSFLWTSTVCVCTSLAFFTIYNKVLCNCYIFYIL